MTTTTRLRKGEATRRLILERAAPVFNKRGYAGASMSELVEATGIEKGGIYNHFGSKEELAVDAFDYAISLIVDGYAAVQEGKVGLDRLVAIIEIFDDWSGHPLVAGGCPIMNTAIEADDTNPPLAARARPDSIRRSRTHFSRSCSVLAARAAPPAAPISARARDLSSASRSGSRRSLRSRSAPARAG